MKKTILYIATAATIAAVSVIAIIGCNDGGANAGRVSEEVNAFLNRFDNAVPAGTVTPPTPDRFTVYFNSNGGGKEPQEIIEYSGAAITLPDRQTMQKEGYSFGGWNTKDDGTGDGLPANSPYTVTQSITLYAVWTAINYTITYTIGDGSVTSANPTSYTIETSFTLNNPTSTRPCYKFAGWTGSNGSSRQTSVSVSRGNTGALSYVANWDHLTYTLTTNVSPTGGGTVLRNPNQTTPYSCGESVNLTATAADGYTFKNWSGASTSTSASMSVTMNSEMTLTAKFEEIFGTFTDSRNAKTYKTVKIGEQWWMAENLNYEVDSSWCYGNDNANCTKYGRLYQWSAAMDLSSYYNSNTWSGSDVNHQGICPASSHLPSNSEWTALVNAVGSPAGTKLKSSKYWTYYSDSYIGTDDYGFSALPGGHRFSGGGFGGAGDFGDWWTATESGASNAYPRGMSYVNDGVYSYDADKSYGRSVRCVQD